MISVQESIRAVVAGAIGSAALLVTALPATAFAQGTEAATPASDPDVLVARAFAAAIAMGASALGAGYAQARIGAAGAGTLAERPEAATSVLVLLVLPELIVLLGFVIAFMIGTAE